MKKRGKGVYCDEEKGKGAIVFGPAFAACP